MNPLHLTTPLCPCPTSSSPWGLFCRFYSYLPTHVSASYISQSVFTGRKKKKSPASFVWLIFPEWPQSWMKWKVTLHFKARGRLSLARLEVCFSEDFTHAVNEKHRCTGRCVDFRRSQSTIVSLSPELWIGGGKAGARFYQTLWLGKRFMLYLSCASGLDSEWSHLVKRRGKQGVEQNITSYSDLNQDGTSGIDQTEWR